MLCLYEKYSNKYNGVDGVLIVLVAVVVSTTKKDHHSKIFSVMNTTGNNMLQQVCNSHGPIFSAFFGLVNGGSSLLVCLLCPHAILPTIASGVALEVL